MSDLDGAVVVDLVRLVRVRVGVRIRVRVRIRARARVRVRVGVWVRLLLFASRLSDVSELLLFRACVRGSSIVSSRLQPARLSSTHTSLEESAAPT